MAGTPIWDIEGVALESVVPAVANSLAARVIGLGGAVSGGIYVYSKLVLEPQAGAVYYVNGTTGSDAAGVTGLTPAAPFKTITHALVHCVANAYDYIIVYGVDVASETWPINVNKHRVHIIGSSFSVGMGRVAMPPADTAAFLITADKVEIAGFEMGCGANHGCIETNPAAQTWGMHIHHNDFGWMNVGRDGIYMPAGFDVPHALIHDNRFNDKLTRDGIRIGQNSTRGEIWNNQFRKVGGIGVNLEGLCTDIYSIHNNAFHIPDAVDGEAISCSAGSMGCMFYENRAFQLIAVGFIPYRDLGANHWGMNFSNVSVVVPAIV